jgi:hypothetical protein
MSTFTNYLILALVILILLLTFTYSTDYLQFNNLLTQETESSENFSYSSDIEYEKEKNENMGDFLIDTNEMETDVPHRPGKLYKFNYEKYKKKKKKWGGIDF